MPNRLPSQPHWKTATTTPSDAPIDSRFMTAACKGIRSDRKTMSSRSADRRTTTPIKSHSFEATTWAKSICVAVKPPT